MFELSQLKRLNKSKKELKLQLKKQANIKRQSPKKPDKHTNILRRLLESTLKELSMP